MKDCIVCGGTGTIYVPAGDVALPVSCSTCRGTGKV